MKIKFKRIFSPEAGWGVMFWFKVILLFGIIKCPPGRWMYKKWINMAVNCDQFFRKFSSVKSVKDSECCRTKVFQCHDSSWIADLDLYMDAFCLCIQSSTASEWSWMKISHETSILHQDAKAQIEIFSFYMNWFEIHHHEWDQLSMLVQCRSNKFFRFYFNFFILFKHYKQSISWCFYG